MAVTASVVDSLVKLNSVLAALLQEPKVSGLVLMVDATAECSRDRGSGLNFKRLTDRYSTQGLKI
ncbi:hypothetical protein CS542_03200 [Pedobacter sp. IW39]|nr:hypothetical protein CS542_03200 [Pedobacter sp. IW39]